MAVITIPDTAVEQQQQNQSVNEAGIKGFQRSFKDGYATLETAANGLSIGDTLDSQVLRNYTLTRCPGNMGVLTLTLSPSDAGSGEVTQKAIRAVWTCKSVRNDLSILAYCGSAANRVNLELWMKESDADTANANSFHKNATVTDTLNSQEIAIATKIKKGIDSVIRFYPVLTCKSTWSRIPNSFFDNLGYIDTPGAPSADTVEEPSNLSTLIQNHSWLKCQDDIDETGDGTFTRIESWMGIYVGGSSQGWDTNLYGTSRWSMPIAVS